MSRSTAGTIRPAPSVVRRIAALAVVGWAALSGSGPVSAQEASETPFIVFDRSHPLMPVGDVPMVQVFDSGRVVVTRGPGWARPGRFEFQLDAAELARLETLAASGASASPPAAAEPVREIVDGREVFTVVHDAVTTSMRVRVAGTDGGLTLAGAPETVRVIEVENLADLADAPVRSVGTAALVDLERSLLDVFAQPLGEGAR